MLPFSPVLTSDGMSSSFAEDEQEVRLRNQATDLEPAKRASAFILQMDTIAQQVSLRAGGATLIQGEGAESISNISREYFAPDALDRVILPVILTPRWPNFSWGALDFAPRRPNSSRKSVRIRPRKGSCWNSMFGK